MRWIAAWIVDEVDCRAGACSTLSRYTGALVLFLVVVVVVMVVVVVCVCV